MNVSSRKKAARAKSGIVRANLGEFTAPAFGRE
jgi:hypothetical protein